MKLSFKTISIYLVGTLAVLGSLFMGANSVYNLGVTDGVDQYHSYCYDNGGYIINDKPPHTIVDCSGLDILSPEEYAELMRGGAKVPKVQQSS